MTAQELLERAAEARRADRLKDARRDVTEAVHLCRAAKDPVLLARSLAAMGQIERDLHHLDAALQAYSESVAILRRQGDQIRLAHVVRHVADLYQDSSRLREAEPCYSEAIAIYRSLPEMRHGDLANAVRGLALLRQRMGELEQARALWEEARDLYEAAGVQQGVRETTRRIARLAASSES